MRSAHCYSIDTTEELFDLERAKDLNYVIEEWNWPFQWDLASGRRGTAALTQDPTIFPDRSFIKSQMFDVNNIAGG